MGAKEVGRKLTDRGEVCGRGSRSLEDELKQFKVYYVPEAAENLLVYLDWKTRWRQRREKTSQGAETGSGATALKRN